MCHVFTNLQGVQVVASEALWGNDTAIVSSTTPSFLHHGLFLHASRCRSPTTMSLLKMTYLGSAFRFCPTIKLSWLNRETLWIMLNNQLRFVSQQILFSKIIPSNSWSTQKPHEQCFLKQEFKSLVSLFTCIKLGCLGDSNWSEM